MTESTNDGSTGNLDVYNRTQKQTEEEEEGGRGGRDLVRGYIDLFSNTQRLGKKGGQYP